MELKDVLVRERKTRGLSQEELAARVQVSRQAVSKWENGDALPDLPRLLALADALGISLDTLCGREAVSPERSAEPAGNLQKRSRIWLGVCVLLVLCLLAGGIRAWVSRNVVESAEAEAETTLPETFAATGERFCGAGAGQLTYLFTPSVAGEDYTYQITFTGLDGQAQTFDAPYSGGVCTDTVYLSQAEHYQVTVLVRDGSGSRAASLARDLHFDETGAEWTPVS